MTTHRLRCLGILAALAFALTGGVPVPASAQQAVLYEIVENLDTMTLLTTNHRVSYWTAQGTAEVGSPFCPAAAFPGATTCAITAFGTDDIDLAALSTSLLVGKVWANVVAVANDDNVVDAAEVATFSGQITGDLMILQPNGAPPVQPDLGKKKSILGPAIPLIYVVNGKFFPDALPTVRTSPPSVLPATGQTATFESVFRLPLQVVKVGKKTTFAKPVRGKNAFYLGDDGQLVKVHPHDEFAQGMPLLRGEVFFTTP